jgi:RNA polymerase sigma factor (sigma-70 family)
MRTRATATADFDDLFRSVWSRAVTTARRIVGPGGDPEALAAEALTRAFDRWPSVGRHPAPDAWVLRVTINLALDKVRRTPATTSTSAPVASSSSSSGGEAFVDLREGSMTHGLVVDSSDDATAVRLALGAALRALPEKQRHAVALRYLAGCQEDEIAASLGVAPGTVKTHLKRGLAKLRAELGADLEAPVALAP